MTPDMPATRYVCTDAGQHNRIVLGFWTEEDHWAVYHRQRDSRRPEGWEWLGESGDLLRVSKITPEINDLFERRAEMDTQRSWLEVSADDATVHFRCPKCRRHKPWKSDRLDAARAAGVDEVDISRV